jgi:thioredoxin-related protein
MAALLVGLIVFASPAAAAELLMFRRVGCPYCHAWDQRIGPIYPRSDLGRELPLHMIDLDMDPKPAVALARPVRYTPTFVVTDDGREIGRIEGFPGEEFFWGLLDKLARRLPTKS